MFAEYIYIRLRQQPAEANDFTKSFESYKERDRKIRATYVGR